MQLIFAQRGAVSAEIGNNFIENFCSHALSDTELKLFNTDECRVRTRDVAKNLFRSFNETQQANEKFQHLWRLRNQYWSQLSPDQQNTCDKNLQKLSQSLFQKEHEAQTERANCFARDIASIEGEHAEELKKHLIADGKVGITKKGEIVTADKVTSEDLIAEIHYYPKQEPPVIVRLPADRNWQLSGESAPRGRVKTATNLERGTAHKLYYDRVAMVSINLQGLHRAEPARLSLENKEFFKDLPKEQREAYERLGISDHKQTCYDILQISPTANVAEIKKALKRLSMQYHPDKHIKDDPDEAKVNEEAFKIVNNAAKRAISHTENHKLGEATRIPDLSRFNG